MLSKTALFALTSMLVSATAWAIPQARACRSGSQPRVWIASDGPMCLMFQDPWQDCAEDPWQLLSRQPSEFSDPWQDSGDPWQPFPAPFASTTKPSDDPWQPVAARSSERSRTTVRSETFDDPWQPASYADPWQEGAEDP
jgi:hypothetical protein